MTLDLTRLRFDTYSAGIPGNPGYQCSVRVSDQQTGYVVEVQGQSPFQARAQALEMLQEKLNQVSK